MVKIEKGNFGFPYKLIFRDEDEGEIEVNVYTSELIELRKKIDKILKQILTNEQYNDII